MTIEHVPGQGVTTHRSGYAAEREVAVTSDGGATIAPRAIELDPRSTEAAERNVHCSGYNVWA